VLSVENLSVAIDQTVIFDDVSFSLAEGDLLLIAGASGAGKSLLLRALVGLTQPQTGRIRLGDADIASLPPSELRARMVYVPQNPPRLPGTVEENLRAVRGHKAISERVEAWEETVKQARILGLADALDRDVEHLSGGEAQRMGLLRALQLCPDVLLLDEPTSALDPDTTARVIQHLDDWRQRPGHALVWVAHGLEGLAERATHRLTVGA
jgi:putative ABC transport system ATP-binding protein